MKRFTGKGKGNLKRGRSTGFSNRMQAALYDISRNKKKLPLSIGTFSPPEGTQDTPYYYDTSVFFAGAPPTRYTLNGTLPTGLNFDELTGVISGTPTIVETLNNISITGTNLAGSDTTDEASIVIISGA